MIIHNQLQAFERAAPEASDRYVGELRALQAMHDAFIDSLEISSTLADELRGVDGDLSEIEEDYLECVDEIDHIDAKIKELMAARKRIAVKADTKRRQIIATELEKHVLHEREMKEREANLEAYAEEEAIFKAAGTSSIRIVTPQEQIDEPEFITRAEH